MIERHRSSEQMGARLNILSFELDAMRAGCLSRCGPLAKDSIVGAHDRVFGCHRSLGRRKGVRRCAVGNRDAPLRLRIHCLRPTEVEPFSGSASERFALRENCRAACAQLSSSRDSRWEKGEVLSNATCGHNIVMTPSVVQGCSTISFYR
jgi:hypothetical protein